MLDRAIFLLFLHFVMCSLSSPLYPALRQRAEKRSGSSVICTGIWRWYSPLPITGKVVSFQLQESGPVQSHNLSVEEQEEGNFLTDSAEKRMQRHADAIFTDHYRKVLSAQKILQGIYGKRLGAGSPRDEEHGFLTRRQSDSILMDSRYQQQMVLKNFLGAMLQNQRLQDINSHHLDNFVSVLSKLMEL